MATAQRGRTTSQRTATGRRSSSAGRTYSSGRSGYIQGTAVRKLDQQQTVRQPRTGISNTTRKNREKAGHMNPAYVLFLCVALIATGIILVNYIGLQSDITSSVKRISRLESELNELKLANDEEYIRVSSNVDLEEIRRIAIQELGMQYAEEGQIVTFSGDSNDYVKQMADIP
jgi:cytochrome c biogenesis factor